MKTNSLAERIALNPSHPRKPIQYWVAELNGVEIDRNNSIALLRYKHKGKTIFKAIR